VLSQTRHESEPVGVNLKVPLDPAQVTVEPAPARPSGGGVSVLVLALTDDGVHATPCGDPKILAERLGRLIHTLAEYPTLLGLVAGAQGRVTR
jgi:hypothetical protein